MSKLHSVKVDPTKILWVNPQKLINIGIGWGKFNKIHEFGKIVGGHWDLNAMPFEDLNVYRSLKARFVHGARWEDTSYYQGLQAQLARGKNPWGVRSKSDLVKRLDSLDCLFEQIRISGYKTQKHLLDNELSQHTLDEVTVRIGRHGQLLFEDGRHRLAIAKILKLSKIPVMVTWRHREWFLFRAEILDYIRRDVGKTYMPITHPDFSDIPTAHGDTRFRLIRSNLPVEGGTLLDIGTNWGYFCHKFEDEGFQCYAVERSSSNFYFLNRLKIAEERRFAAVHTDIFEFWEKSEFDVVLALNIFHHFLKTADDYYKLVQFLRRLKTKVMFFEPHLPSEAQMHGAYRNYDNEEFVKFVAKNTGLPQYECIGHGEEGRPVYKLTRE